MVFNTLKLVKPLLEGDYRTAWEIIRTYTGGGRNNLYIYHVLLTNAMRHIGELWENDVISVADEHLASAVCDGLVTKCQSLFLPKMVVPQRAMAFCLEGEQHFLGIKMVASTLEELGYDVRLYGKDLPLEYALLGAMRWKPDLIAISISMSYNLPRLKQYVEELENLAHRPTVLVGGRLTTLYDLTPYCSPRTVILKDLLQLLDWLAIHAEPQESLVGRLE